MQPKWKRGDLVRTTARLMFGRTVIPQGTQVSIHGHFSFLEELAYEGDALLSTGPRRCYPLWCEDLEEVT
jgi:hypothetical protein